MSFSPASMFSSALPSRRTLFACIAVVGAATFVAGRQSQSFVTVSPFTICSAETEAAFPEEAAYLRANDTAMDKMMSAMVIQPSGDVDHDFVAMMTPHHQGAIEMAQAVLRSGHNEQIKRMAQEIIVTQQQEIAAMRLAIRDPLPQSVAAPTQVPASQGPLASILSFFKSSL